MKHVIIGGVAGGATAAARIRRIDEFAEIVMLEKGNYISYANCGLPYYIGGTRSGKGCSYKLPIRSVDVLRLMSGLGMKLWRSIPRQKT